MELPVFTVSQFVAVFNQTLEYAFPSVTIEGEISNMRVSRGKWVYLDLKDAECSVKCFGTVFQLPGPLEDGMLMRIIAVPRLHQLYGFSLNIMTMMPVGEGSIKKAADLLAAKLQAEGLFDISRKRIVPHAPEHIALITSGESAAYKDFIKILSARFGGITIQLIDSQVQGDAAVADIVSAIERANQLDPLPEVIVITRGGGSADDLAVFNTEQVVRAVASSRIPTVVAIGHEVDTSLAELTADLRASTPSNAAELLVPDRKEVSRTLKSTKKELTSLIKSLLTLEGNRLDVAHASISQSTVAVYESQKSHVYNQAKMIELLNPRSILKRGYALVRDNRGKVVRTVNALSNLETISIELTDGISDLKVK